MQLNTFTFNNTNSQKYNVIMSDPFPTYQKAKKRTQSINIPGSSGTLYKKTDEYEEKVIVINCIAKDRQYINNIKQWLDGSGDLILGTQPDKKYKAEIIDSIEFTDTLLRKGYTFTLKVNVDPFLYPITNEKIEITETGTVINNNGNVPSIPFIRIYGSGTVAIAIGSQMLEIKNVTSYVDIDGMFGVYKNNVSYDKYTTGTFPIMLELGKNTISYSDNVTMLEFYPNTKYL